MSEMDPYARLEYEGDLDPVMERVCDEYSLGDYAGFDVVPVGYEDFNAVLQTSADDYFVKMFASSRTEEDIDRFSVIMQGVMRHHIRHPRILEGEDGMIHTDERSQLQLVVMEYVEGQTFYDLHRVPTDEELDKVLRQAVLINQMDVKPPYLYDSWAIANLPERYELIKEFLTDEEQTELEVIIDEFSAVDHDGLPRSFVHGDMTKSNVIKADDGGLYVVDFSVANIYPRIQELAVIIGNLVNDPDSAETVLQTMRRVVSKYVEQGGELTAAEMQALPSYVRAAYAMEFVGASVEKFISRNDSPENDYWRNLGWSGITRSLS